MPWFSDCHLLDRVGLFRLCSHGGGKSRIRSFDASVGCRTVSEKRFCVNTICGGLIQTDALNYFPEGELMISRAEEATPLGRMGLPDDIAGAAWLLTRPEAGWVTGQTLVVDGGLSLL